MIPVLAVVCVRTERSHRFRLWLPLFLVWLLLLPLVLVLMPISLVACLVIGINPFRALTIGWQFVTGLTGTHVEVENGKSQILVHIS
jgi:uncharacterized membrane protein